MSCCVYVVEPGRIHPDRFTVVVMSIEPVGTPEIRETETQDEAERIAAELAAAYGCEWKYSPQYDDSELAHWLDEEGVPRNMNRIVFEVIDRDSGLLRWQLWSDDVLLDSETGRRGTLPAWLMETQWILAEAGRQYG